MVFTGKPSAGCLNCRKAKKRCDQGRPACSRCVRLGKVCGGYRDVSELMFRNETATVARKASLQSEIEASVSSSGAPSPPEIEVAGKQFFFDQFVTAGHLPFLDGVLPDEILLKPIMACSLMARANRENDESGRESARRYYVEAITATNDALRHPRRAKEDNTLVSVCLLSIFERLACEEESPSINSWRQHVEGAAQVLHFRGRSQLAFNTGIALFRELRGSIISNALMNEILLPEYVAEWTHALEYDAIQTPSDQLALISSKIAALKVAYAAGSNTDSELSEQCSILEQDLLTWSESMLVAGSVFAFSSTHDPNSAHAWNGTRHEYGGLHAHRQWNMWRCVRIILSRVQEAIWRRSWLIEGQHPPGTPVLARYSTIRTQMVNDVCIATAYALGNDPDRDPPKGAVSSGYLILVPLFMAGTCLLEQLANPIVSPGGSRRIFVDEPLHLNLFDQKSVQLGWIIERLDYIATRVGIRWAAQMSRLLSADSKLYFDLGRSRVVRQEELESQLESHPLDLDSLLQLSDVEET